MEETLVCKECGKVIEMFEKFARNDKDGTVLCMKCFQKLMDEGVIG